MDISTTDTSVPRARQLRDEPQSGRYPTRGYQQRQPSLERGVADQTDLKNDVHGTSVLRKELITVRSGGVCPLDRRQPYQRFVFRLLTEGCWFESSLRSHANKTNKISKL
jgi:hypothetical protein